MEKLGSIPIVDCSQGISASADYIVSALKSASCAYLKNSGITQEQVSQMFEACDSFWRLPLTVKEQYGPMLCDLEKAEVKGGFVSEEVRAPDLVEIFDVVPFCGHPMEYPPDHVAPNFERRVQMFFNDCHPISLEILEAIGTALNFPDPDLFVKAHQLPPSYRNSTSMLLINYPATKLLRKQSIDINTNRMRKHVDYGTITLLFQDEVGGLEVVDSTGNYAPVEPLPGALFLMAGDLLQTWTNGFIRAAEHQVKVTGTSTPQRHSVGFFVQPEVNYKVEPIALRKDTVIKYEAITGIGQLTKRISARQ